MLKTPDNMSKADAGTDITDVDKKYHEFEVVTIACKNLITAYNDLIDKTFVKIKLQHTEFFAICALMKIMGHIMDLEFTSTSVERNKYVASKLEYFNKMLASFSLEDTMFHFHGPKETVKVRCEKPLLKKCSDTEVEYFPYRVFIGRILRDIMISLDELKLNNCQIQPETKARSNNELTNSATVLSGYTLRQILDHILDTKRLCSLNNTQNATTSFYLKFDASFIKDTLLKTNYESSVTKNDVYSETLLGARNLQMLYVCYNGLDVLVDISDRVTNAKMDNVPYTNIYSKYDMVVEIAKPRCIRQRIMDIFSITDKRLPAVDSISAENHYGKIKEIPNPNVNFSLRSYNSLSGKEFSANVKVLPHYSKTFIGYTCSEIRDPVHIKPKATKINKTLEKNLSTTTDKLPTGNPRLDTILYSNDRNGNRTRSDNSAKKHCLETKFDSSSIFSEHNLNEINNRLGGMKRNNSQESRPVTKNVEKPVSLDIFNGYSLSQVMNSINRTKNLQHLEKKSADNAFDINALPKYTLRDLIDKGFRHKEEDSKFATPLRAKYLEFKVASDHATGTKMDIPLSNCNSKSDLKFNKTASRFGCIGQEAKTKRLKANLNTAEVVSRSVKRDYAKMNDISHDGDLSLSSYGVYLKKEDAQFNRKTSKNLIAEHSTDIKRLDQIHKLQSQETGKVWSDYCRYNGHSSICPYGKFCEFIDKCLCIYCGIYCLPKNDLLKKVKHEYDCWRSICADKEYNAFCKKNEISVRSKTCDLCKTVLCGKVPYQNRFCAIMSSCEHVFCLKCVEKCRTDLPGFGRRNILICKSCKTFSTFYARSSQCIDEENKREFLINYKESLKTLKYESCPVYSGNEIKAGTKTCYYDHTISTC